MERATAVVDILRVQGHLSVLGSHWRVHLHEHLEFLVLVERDYLIGVKGRFVLVYFISFLNIHIQLKCEDFSFLSYFSGINSLY